MANFIQSKKLISTPVSSFRNAAATMQRPPPTRVPMPPQEQANARDSSMKRAVLVLGWIPAARISGIIVAMPMAVAAASCITDEPIPRPIERMKVKRTTLVPARLAMAWLKRSVSSAFSRAMARIRQHMMKTTTGCI